MEQILKFIGGTKEQYNLLLITNYQQWCEIQAYRSDQLLQKIMLDQAVNNWYITELKKLESAFLESVKPLANSKYINYSQMKRQYLSTIKQIRRIYPKPLLDAYKPAKSNQIATFNYN